MDKRLELHVLNLDLTTSINGNDNDTKNDDSSEDDFAGSYNCHQQVA